jgi:hypothetical protein
MTNQTDSRFYTATKDRCFKIMKIPFTVKLSLKHLKMISNCKFHELIFSEQAVDTDFVAWLCSIGLKIRLGRLFINPKNYNYNLHVDIRESDNQSAVLNFAFNDIGTVFSWYNLKPEAQPGTVLNENKIPIYDFSPDDCIEILRCEISHDAGQPFLLNTGHIHTLKVADTNRYCFSYFLTKISDDTDLQWDEAVEIFAPYIQQQS